MLEFTGIVQLMNRHMTVSYVALTFMFLLYLFCHCVIVKHFSIAYFRRLSSRYRNTAAINKDNLQFEITLQLSTQPESIKWQLSDYGEAMDLYTDLKSHYEDNEVAITFHKVNIGG